MLPHLYVLRFLCLFIVFEVVLTISQLSFRYNVVYGCTAFWLYFRASMYCVVVCLLLESHSFFDKLTSSDVTDEGFYAQKNTHTHIHNCRGTCMDDSSCLHLTRFN